MRSRHSKEHLHDDELHETWQRLCLRQPYLRQAEEVALLDMTARSDVTMAINRPFVRLDLNTQLNAQLSPVLLSSVMQPMRRQPLDAVSDRPSMTSWRWAILFVAALLAGVLTIQTIRTRAAVVVLASRLDSLRSASEMRQQSGIAQSLWRREELPRVQAVNAAIRQLNLPIALILRSLVPPLDIRVAVLSVETSGNAVINEKQIIKIVAEAASSTDMARYVAFLGERRPFIRAYLTKHEIDTTSPERPYRFSVEVPWVE